MKNKAFIVLLLFLNIQGFAGKETPDLKNIIIISVDTLRADHLGCYGYPLNTSPEIDKFAKDCVKFNKAYALTPLTGPSFSTMLTALPPFKHGAKRNCLPIYKNIKTLPMVLKKYGYYSSAFISNWTLRRKYTDLQKGFNSYYEVFSRKRWLGIMNSEGLAPDVNRKAINWLKKHHKKRFFMWVGYTDPHIPYDFHQKFSFKDKKLNKSNYPPGTRFKKIRNYDSEIAFTDFHIGKFLKKIKDLGIYKDSLIIFVTDHGESFGEHNYFRHGRKLFNSTVHIALMIKLPGNQLKNTVRNDNVSMINVSPTILSILKLPIPEQMEGLSIINDNNYIKKEIYVETYKGAVIIKKGNKFHRKVKPIRYGIIKDNIKMIFNKKNKTFEAYNLETDRFETHNLLNPTQYKFPELKKRLIEYMSNVKDYIEYTKKLHKQKSELSEKELKILKSLGYVE